MRDIFIGRQPIYDRDLRVFAYELLFRSGAGNTARGGRGDQATSQVIVNAFMEIGLDDLVGPHRAFINLTRKFLMADTTLPFSGERVVLEILEDIEVNEELIEGARRLAGAGYAIALDDFIYHESLLPLVEVADIVKIDIRALDRATIREHVGKLRHQPVKLLAEKVETQDEYEFCRSLDFDYFQGYFFCKPRIIRQRSLSPNRLTTLRVLAALQKPEVKIDELTEIIGQDVTLGYKLLRYINSAYFTLPNPIETIRQALSYLGNQPLRTWVSLLALSTIDDKPHELITTAMVRGKMCELLATTAGRSAPDTFFTVGLFSTLDAMMDLPMEKVIEDLPFSDDIRGALLRHEGPEGRALHCALAYEQGDWEHVRCEGLSAGQFTDAWLEAVRWADNTNRKLATL